MKTITIRIPEEWDEKIEQLLDELRYEGVLTRDITKTEWIRDAIEQELKNQIPISEYINQYNELYEKAHLQDKWNPKASSEIHELWNRFNEIFKLWPEKELYDKLKLQDKINALLKMQNDYCEETDCDFRYEIQSIDIPGAVSNIEVYLQPINPDNGQHFRLCCSFDGNYWADDGYKHQCRCKECIDEFGRK